MGSNAKLADEAGPFLFSPHARPAHGVPYQLPGGAKLSQNRPSLAVYRWIEHNTGYFGVKDESGAPAAIYVGVLINLRANFFSGRQAVIRRRRANPVLECETSEKPTDGPEQRPVCP